MRIVGALRLEASQAPILTDGRTAYLLSTADPKIIKTILGTLELKHLPCMGVVGEIIEGKIIKVEEVFV